MPAWINDAREKAGEPAMCVAEIMIRNPVTVSPANSIGTAIRRMRKSGCRCLPVVEEGRLVGMVTDYELSRAANSPLVVREPWHDHFLLDLIEVRSCMMRDPLTVAPDAHIREVARIVCECGVGGVPVVRGRRLVGLVTTADLLKHLIRLLGG